MIIIVMSLVGTKPFRAPVESVHLLKAITLESSGGPLSCNQIAMKTELILTSTTEGAMDKKSEN